MSRPVVTISAGGLPVVDVTAIAPQMGLTVTEATNGRGLAVTKVIGKPGLPVIYTSATQPVLFPDQDITQAAE